MQRTQFIPADLRTLPTVAIHPGTAAAAEAALDKARHEHRIIVESLSKLRARESELLVHLDQSQVHRRELERAHEGNALELALQLARGGHDVEHEDKLRHELVANRRQQQVFMQARGPAEDAERAAATRCSRIAALAHLPEYHAIGLDVERAFATLDQSRDRVHAIGADLARQQLQSPLSGPRRLFREEAEMWFDAWATHIRNLLAAVKHDEALLRLPPAPVQLAA